MLVRKLKCPNCSAVKVNEIKTGFIYCDFCGTYMGLDMNNFRNEAMDVALSDDNQEKKTEYNNNLLQLADALKNKDIENYKKAAVKMHELDFELYPNRYGPKGKQPAYRQKYMTYYQHMYEETVNDEFFQKREHLMEKITALGAKLKSSIVNNMVHYEFNDDFKDYLNANIDYFKELLSSEKLRNANYMQYYPEYFSDATPDMMMRNTVNGMISTYDEETQKKVIEYLGYKDEYMDVAEVSLKETTCILCAASIRFPEGATSLVCEQCGTKNILETKELECLNCGASYKPEGEEVKCPFCGARTQASKPADYSKVTAKIQEKYYKPLWKRILGI
ncbi:MAG: hypothetical protein JXR58_13825 [Bacteroidales bacterium]|nr:hypothetical protein [Bacteroidales bacterium]